MTRMDDDADGKMILMAPPLENWKRPPEHPHITWLNTIQWDCEPTTSHWAKQSIWLRTALCGSWCLRMALRALSGACRKRRRM